MGGKPAISVVMPVYNGERFLAAAIESILAQTFADFEFIVVDDGSTDGSPDIVRRYRDDRMVVVPVPHGGLVLALNEGVRRARADLIARMDGDDVADRHRFREQERFLRMQPDIALLGTACRIVDIEGRAIGMRYFPTDDFAIRTYMAARSQFAHPSMMIRAICFRETGAYRDVVPEDYDLFARMLTRFRGANLPAPLHALRFHETSYTAGHRRESARYHEAFCRRLLRETRTLSIPCCGRMPDDRAVDNLCRRNPEERRWLWRMQMELGECYGRRGYVWRSRRETIRGMRFLPSFRSLVRAGGQLMFAGRW